MDLEDTLSEITQTKKAIHCVIAIIRGIQKIQQTSENNKKRSRPTDIENKLVTTTGKREVGRRNQRAGE